MSLNNQLLSQIDYHKKLIDLENRISILEGDNKHLKKICEDCIRTTNESIEVVTKTEKTLFKAVKLIKEQKILLDRQPIIESLD